MRRKVERALKASNEDIGRPEHQRIRRKGERKPRTRPSRGEIDAGLIGATGGWRAIRPGNGARIPGKLIFKAVEGRVIRNQ